MTSKELMQRVNVLLKAHGKKGLKEAQKAMSEEKPTHETLAEALGYFMNEVWFDFLHPALLSLASEAVGGKPDETTRMGAAFVLLAGGADVHDDIIDQSTTKEGKATVFGKYGKDIAILAGDALLFKGLYLLHDAVRLLPDKERQQILEGVRQAFASINSAEAKEASLRGKIDIPGDKYLDIIKMKVAVAEATTRIGAIIGKGTPQQIDVLSEYGRVFGILNTVRDEYIDVFDEVELKNRAEKECLPLPILVTFEDPKKKTEILELIKQPTTKETMEKILDLTMDSLETQNLTKDIKALMRQELQLISVIQNCRLELELLLNATLIDL